MYRQHSSYAVINPQAARFCPPPRPPRVRQPTVLTDDLVRQLFAKAPPIIMHDGVVPVEGKIIGWQQTDAGPLGAIVVNPLTDRRALYGIDFKTGRPRLLGSPKPPKR